MWCQNSLEVIILTRAGFYFFNWGTMKFVGRLWSVGRVITLSAGVNWTGAESCYYTQGLPPATWLHQGIITLFSTFHVHFGVDFQADFEDLRWHDVALSWNNTKDHNRSRKLCFHLPGYVPVIRSNPAMVLAVVHLALTEVLFVWKNQSMFGFLGCFSLLSTWRTSLAWGSLSSPEGPTLQVVLHTCNHSCVWDA